MLENQRNKDRVTSNLKVVRVLLAEDSATIRHHLTTIINSAPGIQVIGEAHNGEEALKLIPKLKPDVVSMDIRMPGIDGLEATRRIMMECPTPVVVVSGLVERDIDLSFQALRAGALAVVEKPLDRTHPDFEEKQRHLIKTLMAMSKVSVVRRGNTSRLISEATQESRSAQATPSSPQLIAIGASAGGPSALSKFLPTLPVNLAIPIVIVQHIPHEFMPGLAKWLDKVTPLQVKVVEDGEVLEAGVVHLSPGTAHLTIERQGHALIARFVKEQGEYRYQPSIDVLFESVAKACGSAAIGVILTGMGDDGSEGLLNMRKAGARTLAQDKASSTVFGMPASAVDRGAVEQVVALSGMSSAIMKLL